MMMRRRNMYNATGLPGWMRFGYSPGRAGLGGGMGPCGQFMMTGQWPTPQMAAAMKGMPGVQAAQADPGRLAFLQAQLDTLEQQIGAVREQIAAIESGD
jgi:hypothetical protein